MNEEVLTPGARVIDGGAIVGTSRGKSQLQDLYKPTPQVFVIFDNGRRESVPATELKIATEEDEARSAERIRHDEEANQRTAEKEERKRRAREERIEALKQRKADEEEAEEEAKRVKAMEYTEEMRKVNGRLFGLESLKGEAK